MTRPELELALEQLHHALLLVRARWARGADARDPKGTICQVMAPEAKAFSLYGALLRVHAGDAFRCATSIALEQVVMVLRDHHGAKLDQGWQTVCNEFNSKQGEAELVIAVLEHAFDRVKKRRGRVAPQFELSCRSRMDQRGLYCACCPDFLAVMSERTT